MFQGMDDMFKRLLAHPIAKKPYNAIRFSRFDGNGAPLYRLRKADGEFGAKEALKRAFALHGAHCFHCEKFFAADELGDMTRDHVVPCAANGSDFLHNLLFACKPCNASRGRKGFAAFKLERAEAYLDALNRHLEKSLRTAKVTKRAA